MSQYPSPYSAPTHVPYNPYADYLAPAQRAGLLMFLLSAFGLLCGGCLTAFPWLETWEEFRNQQPQMFEELTRSGLSENAFKITMSVIGGIGLFVAVMFIVLGVFVRKGYLAAIIISLVFCAMTVLLLLLQLVASLTHTSNPADLLSSLCVSALPLAGFILLLIWLTQAIKGSRLHKESQAAYAQQWYEYQRNYQQYQQQMGYNPPAPPQSPPPPPLNPT